MFYVVMGLLSGSLLIFCVTIFDTFFNID